MREEIISMLDKHSKNSKYNPARFFKTDVGDYAQHDKFNGVKYPILRKISKDFQDISIKDITYFLHSKVNEERQLALFMLVNKYNKSETLQKNKLFEFYLENLKYVNNWNLVDTSAHKIIGEHLLNSDKKLLFELAMSQDLWERRVSIVSTYAFIKKGSFDTTIKISEILLNDSHDLIQKAVGWMLREVGKIDESILIKFLDIHCDEMPRTMLRYAIERMHFERRMFYLSKRKNK